MKDLKLHRDLIIAAIVIGVVVNVPPVSRWIDRVFAGTWEGLPWVLLAVLWIGLGTWAYVDHRRRSNGSMSKR